MKKVQHAPKLERRIEHTNTHYRWHLSEPHVLSGVDHYHHYYYRTRCNAAVMLICNFGFNTLVYTFSPAATFTFTSATCSALLAILHPFCLLTYSTAH